jgi:hypothetical protein
MRGTTPLSSLVLAVGVSLLLAAPPAVQAQAERLPRELWEQYPLDPTRGEEEPAEEPAPPPPTTTVEAPAVPQRGAEPAPATVETDDGVPWGLAIALTLGVAGALGVGLGIVLARHRRVVMRSGLGSGAAGTLSAGQRGVHSLAALATGSAGAAAATAAKGRIFGAALANRLRSQTGALAPLAQSRRRRGTSEQEERPPPQAEMPPEPRQATTVEAGPPPAPPAVDLAVDLAPEEAPAPLSVAPEPTARWEECEVDWWRGYVTSDFYALARRPGGETYVAARSPTFRWWRSAPPPEGGRGADAHARLIARLVADGWEQAGGGLAWYRTRLRRRMRPTLRELSYLP